MEMDDRKDFHGLKMGEVMLSFGYRHKDMCLKFGEPTKLRLNILSP